MINWFKDRFNNFFKDFVNPIIDQEYYSKQRNLDLIGLKKNSLKSSLVSVMARNQAHNISSHVLSRFSQEGDLEEVLKEFSEAQYISYNKIKDSKGDWCKAFEAEKEKLMKNTINASFINLPVLEENNNEITSLVNNRNYVDGISYALLLLKKIISENESQITRLVNFAKMHHLKSSSDFVAVFENLKILEDLPLKEFIPKYLKKYIIDRHQLVSFNKVRGSQTSEKFIREDGLIRLIAAVGNLDKSKIENGDYLGDEEETTRYEEADSLIRNYQEDRLFMIDGNMSVNKLKSWVVILKEKGVKTILLDRLALMDEVKAAKSTSESIGIASQICTQFRAICNLMDVNLIMFAQLNSAIDHRAGHYPQMADFFGATGIQAAATIALIISRPYERYGQEFFKGGRNDGQSAEGKAELVIVKNTHGKEDVAVMVDFKGSQSLFIEEKEDWTAYEEVDETGGVKMGSKTNKLPF